MWVEGDLGATQGWRGVHSQGNPSAAHRNYPRQLGGGSCRIVRVLWWKQWVEDFRYVALGHSLPEQLERVA